MDIRHANHTDLSALNALEQQLFTGDKISPRQMRRFLKSAHAAIFVAESGTQLAGYALLLFHQGTQLSRLYSIAVNPDFRGRGIAQQLVGQCERAALDQGACTLRLEVRDDNRAALKLYEKMGYKRLRILMHYYDDQCDGIRMQKRLDPHEPRLEVPVPLYVQTTPFTCGAACLLMSFARFESATELTRTHELQLWREATTIYMTSGHGGCSGHGLALAAARRGFEVELWSRSSTVPFIDGVRDPNKKSVIELVHQDFCQQLAGYSNVTVTDMPPTQAQFEGWLAEGASVLLLISTYRFTGNKEPHWILLSGMSEHFFFIHDPHVDDQSEVVAAAYIPVGKAVLTQIIGYGKQKQTSCVVIRKGKAPGTIERSN